MKKAITALLDCDAGRKMGCRSFCCRLLVRLREEERAEIDPVTDQKKGYVDKKENGTCIYQDEKTGLCLNWENRPQVCREYDCNHDRMLQVVLNSSNNNLAEWMKESVQPEIKSMTKRYVPYLDGTK